MLFGRTVYNEGEMAPERGHEHNWHVYCNTGAIQVLTSGEYVEFLRAHPEGYTINFANGSFARIKPGDPLWQKLAEVAKTHAVGVFPLVTRPRYIPWTGAAGDHKQFDAIRITPRR